MHILPKIDTNPYTNTKHCIPELHGTYHPRRRHLQHQYPVRLGLEGRDRSQDVGGRQKGHPKMFSNAARHTHLEDVKIDDDVGDCVGLCVESCRQLMVYYHRYIIRIRHFDDLIR